MELILIHTRSCDTLDGSGSLTPSLNFRLCSFKNALWIMSQSKMRTKLNMKSNQITVRLTTAGSHNLQDPSVTDMFPWVWLNTTHEPVMYLKLILPCRETGRQLQILFWSDNKSVNDWKNTHLHKNYFKKHKKRKVMSKWDKVGFTAQTNCSELW